MYLTIDRALEVLKEAKERIGGDKCLVLSLTDSGLEDRTINNMRVIYGYSRTIGDCVVSEDAYIQVECSHPALTNTAYIEVEYDTDYFGGDYDKVGSIVLIPANLLDKMSIEEAFEKVRGVSRVHIIHYNPDELVDAYGNTFTF